MKNGCGRASWVANHEDELGIGKDLAEHLDTKAIVGRFFDNADRRTLPLATKPSQRLTKAIPQDKWKKPGQRLLTGFDIAHGIEELLLNSLPGLFTDGVRRHISRPPRNHCNREMNIEDRLALAIQAPQVRVGRERLEEHRRSRAWRADQDQRSANQPTIPASLPAVGSAIRLGHRHSQIIGCPGPPSAKKGGFDTQGKGRMVAGRGSTEPPLQVR